MPSRSDALLLTGHGTIHVLAGLLKALGWLGIKLLEMLDRILCGKFQESFAFATQFAMGAAAFMQIYDAVMEAKDGNYGAAIINLGVTREDVSTYAPLYSIE